MGFPARNLIIAGLLDRIADGRSRRTEVPSDNNQDISSPYAESLASNRTITATDTPSDPFPYSTGGQQDVGYDSRDLARTGDAIGTDGARVLRKGMHGGKRNGLIAPRRDG